VRIAEERGNYHKRGNGPEEGREEFVHRSDWKSEAIRQSNGGQKKRGLASKRKGLKKGVKRENESRGSNRGPSLRSYVEKTN